MNEVGSVISLSGIQTRFGEQEIHRGIDLEVGRGEKLALMGGSGSGKTTLLRVMLGLLEPEDGRVRVLGRDIGLLEEREQQRLRNRYGVLFQAGALFSDLSVLENIALPMEELGLADRGMIRELVVMKLAMVGLEPRVGRLLPHELSGGMIRRVGLARALALEPELLFLDEPTAGLDPVSARRFVELINGLHRDLGFTMVMVTHDVASVRDVCDHLAVLADGELAAEGGLAEVMAVDHPVIRDFFHGAARPGQAD